MKSIRPGDISARDFYSYMVGAVVPRPIAFVSSMSKEGKVNLSPYSFFNAFSAKPPVLVFGPVNSMRDGSTKNTLDNVLEHEEVTVNIVNYPMVEQMSLASTAYPKGINEFGKSGLTEATSELVKPPRVTEAPVSFECKVSQVIHLGQEGGAGNLVICEVLLIHIQDEVLDDKGSIDPQKLDAVGRMGGSYYCRASGDAIFTTLKPDREHGIGVDQLPESIRTSSILTGGDLAQLANVSKCPSSADLAHYQDEPEIKTLRASGNIKQQHKLAQQYIRSGKITLAWAVLMV